MKARESAFLEAWARTVALRFAEIVAMLFPFLAAA